MVPVVVILTVRVLVITKIIGEWFSWKRNYLFFIWRKFEKIFFKNKILFFLIFREMSANMMLNHFLKQQLQDFRCFPCGDSCVFDFWLWCQDKRHISKNLAWQLKFLRFKDMFPYVIGKSFFHDFMKILKRIARYRGYSLRQPSVASFHLN